jgi:hypothetical protein
VLGALSDCYKAIEHLQAESTPKSEVVYLRAAATKLETGEKALRKMQDILTSVRPTDEMLAWLKELDYDRLYQYGTQRGLIPSNETQWDRLAQINRTQGYLGVAGVLIDDANGVRIQIEALIEALAPVNAATCIKRDNIQDMLRLQSTLADFAAFGQMVAYVNAIEPLTDEWRGAAVATATIF